MRQASHVLALLLAAMSSLAAAGCSAEAPGSPTSSSLGTPLAGSTTPNMADVTGQQSRSMYDPYLGMNVYGLPTAPPGKAYGR